VKEKASQPCDSQMNRKPRAIGRTKRAAEVLSVIGHPFTVLPVTIVLVTMRNAGPRHALAIGSAAALLIVVPLILVIRRKVVAGQ
jgi:hypothetical protein